MAFTAALLVYISGKQIWFLAPFCLIVTAYGIAIPNILSMALLRYKNETGSAGAVFELIYYVLIGSGLVITRFINIWVFLSYYSVPFL